MKKKSILILLTFLLMLIFAMPVSAGSVFTDVNDDDWFAPYVYDLAENNILSGYSDGSFKPGKTITRGEFVKILAYASGENLAKYNGTLPFTDAQNHWSKTNILWAYENGIVNGTSETTFSPDNNITRQELSVMIYRYADYKKIELPKTKAKVDFADADQTATWAKDAVAAMQQAEIISGYPDNTFRPTNNATRAESSKLISTYEVIEEKEIAKKEESEKDDPVKDDPVNKVEFLDSGKWGIDESIAWTIDSNYVLTFSGSGLLYGGANIDSGLDSGVPWGEWADKIKKVVIESGITGISSCLFGGMNLKSVDLPETISEIDYSSFYYYGEDSQPIKLLNVNIDKNNPVYKSVDGVVYSKDGKTLVYVPYGRTGNFIIPDVVKEIGIGAFYLSFLDSVTISDGVQKIDEYAFRESRIKNVVMPDSVTEIGESAFAWNYELENIYLSKNLSSIESGVFWACKKVKSITIPSSVSKIKNSAFDHMDSLQEINVEKNNKDYSSINGVLYNKNITKMIACPAAKQGHLIIPDTVSEIESYAFPQSGILLQAITIPSSVKEIRSYTFNLMNYPNLTDIYYKGAKKDLLIWEGNNAFSNVTWHYEK